VQENALIPQTTFKQSQQVAAKENSTFRKKVESPRPLGAAQLHVEKDMIISYVFNGDSQRLLVSITLFTDFTCYTPT